MNTAPTSTNVMAMAHAKRKYAPISQSARRKTHSRQGIRNENVRAQRATAGDDDKRNVERVAENTSLANANADKQHALNVWRTSLSLYYI